MDQADIGNESQKERMDIPNVVDVLSKHPSIQIDLHSKTGGDRTGSYRKTDWYVGVLWQVLHHQSVGVHAQ